MAGYSATPLWKKLGYTTGCRTYLFNAPSDYLKLLTLPANLEVTWAAEAERGLKFVHLFATEAGVLTQQLGRWRKQIAKDGVIWVSWPKKSSGVVTSITEDTIRRIALPLGLVDIKVCAVDATWSGLKLMIRKTER